MKIDTLDSRILKALQENARLSYRKIARKAGTSVVTAMNRIKRLEREGLIDKYTLKLNLEKAGYDIDVIIDVRVSKGRLFQVERQIASHPNVQAVYDITGPFDSVVIAKFRNRREMDAFIKRIQTYDFVERTETKLILNIVKEDSIRV